MKKIALILSLIAFAFIFAASADAADERDWTVLVYMDADNDLGPYLMAGIKEIERGLAANPGAKVDVLFLVDRAKGYYDGYILRLQDDDIDRDLEGEFLMQFIPISEYRKQLQIEDIKEEKEFEVARNMCSEGLSLELVKKCTGLDEEGLLCAEYGAA